MKARLNYLGFIFKAIGIAFEDGEQGRSSEVTEKDEKLQIFDTSGPVKIVKN